MKTRKYTGAALLGMVVTIAAAVGCMPPAQGPKEPEGEPAAASTSPDTEPGASGGSGPQVASAGAPKEAGSQAAVSAAPPAPKNAAECTALAAKPLTTPAASSSSDPQKQLDELFLAHHETFRCCFDALHAPKAPRVDGTMALLVKVDSAGKLTSSEVVLSETSVQAPDVQACVLDVAKALAYPKPTNDMDVGYKRVFNWKARR